MVFVGILCYILGSFLKVRVLRIKIRKWFKYFKMCLYEYDNIYV